jgi:hypothetical protein
MRMTPHPAGGGEQFQLLQPLIDAVKNQEGRARIARLKIGADPLIILPRPARPD